MSHSGSALLVHPVTDARASGVNVYFPGTDEVGSGILRALQLETGEFCRVRAVCQKQMLFLLCRFGTTLTRTSLSLVEIQRTSSSI